MTQDIWDTAAEVETQMVKFSDENKKPIVGKKIEGVLISRKTQPNTRSNTPGAESVFYEIFTAEGVKGFFAPTILDRKLKDCHGKIVRVEATGSVKVASGNMAHTFSVRALPNTPENRTLLGLNALGEEVGKDEKGEDDITGDIPF